MVKSTARSVDVPAAVVWDVRDGKVIHLQEYFDTWAFMDAWKAGTSATRRIQLWWPPRWIYGSQAAATSTADLALSAVCHPDRGNE